MDLQLFQTLTELPGAPGNEHAVRAFMREQLQNMLMILCKIGLGAFLE